MNRAQLESQIGSSELKFLEEMGLSLEEIIVAQAKARNQGKKIMELIFERHFIILLIINQKFPKTNIL